MKFEVMYPNARLSKRTRILVSQILSFLMNFSKFIPDNAKADAQEKKMYMYIL